jgi:hypothetical protein
LYLQDLLIAMGRSLDQGLFDFTSYEQAGNNLPISVLAHGGSKANLEIAFARTSGL